MKIRIKEKGEKRKKKMKHEAVQHYLADLKTKRRFLEMYFKNLINNQIEFITRVQGSLLLENL